MIQPCSLKRVLLKRVLRAHLLGCYTFISCKLYKSDLKYDHATMFLLDGNQDFTTGYVNRSNVVIIWIKDACRTIILMQNRLGGKSYLFAMGYSYFKGQ